MKPETFDIVVVGGGHAGCEAALAAARLGARTALVTIRADRIAEMSCNPAIGGLAKGQIVREIDALGGEMARITDATAIQYRLLNESKGPAVRSPRAQCDRRAYALAMQAVLRGQAGLTICEEVVCDILTAGGRVAGVRCESGTELAARAVILTTGTFLRGVLHVGPRMWPGGRIEEPAAEHLSASLQRLGLRLGRLKTGTPPRVDGKTLDFSRMTEQPSDLWPVRFSYGPPGPTCIAGNAYAARRCTREPVVVGEVPGAQKEHVIPSERSESRNLAVEISGCPDSRRDPSASLGVTAGRDVAPTPRRPQPVSCWITHTTPEVHTVILANLDRSPMYSGQIQSTGPRYCPSLETKIVRFRDRTSHQVFLEPEGRATDVVYCNGISTSLPEDVQDRIVHGIPGMENARILRYGYAIEYDFVPPTQTQATLESKIVPGLFLAGQINGTSGYEEAAGQGLIAGINAARAIRSGVPEAPVVLGRDQAYIGVLIDDLVTKGAEEPYRMFTSLAEYRLLLRHDNADRRLTPLGRQVGLVTGAAWQRFEVKAGQIGRAQELLRRLRRDGRTLEDLLRRPEVTWPSLVAEVPELAALDVPEEAGEQVEIEAKYAGYLARQQAQVDRARRMEDRPIPPDFDYSALSHLRHEAREKFARIRPRSLGQAARIAGISPADLAVVMIHLMR